MKKIIALLLCLSFVFCLSSCGNGTMKIGEYTVKNSNEPTNFVKIVMKNGDAMLLELYPEVAPITVENFKGLVSEKYYDGISFHRVIYGFMIQGGDPDGDGYSNRDKPNIKGEFSANGYNNTLLHERGVISMARQGDDMDSASTQFFIVHKTPDPYYNSLDGQYAAFGRLLAGYDTLDKIASVQTNASDKPLNDQVMKEVRFVTIESKGN